MTTEAEKYLAKRNRMRQDPGGDTSVDLLENAKPELAGTSRLTTRPADDDASVKLIGLSLLSGLFAIVAAIIRQLTIGMPDLLAAVMVAPPVEEILKAALPIMVLEHRTKWLGQGKDLLWFAMGSALVFSVIENLLYTFVYLDNPSAELLQWRWTACTAMHVAATGLTGVGLMRAYNRAHTINQKPRFVWEWPWLAGAIAVHMAYNAFVVMSAVN